MATIHEIKRLKEIAEQLTYIQGRQNEITASIIAITALLNKNIDAFNELIHVINGGKKGGKES